MEFEHRHGISLPPTYRSFLLEVGDGPAGPAYGILGLDELPPADEALFDLRVDSLAPGFLTRPFPCTTAQPGPGRGGTNRRELTGSLVIGESGCGSFSRLVISGLAAGQVWTEDQVWGVLSPGPDFHSWYTAWLADPAPATELDRVRPFSSSPRA